MGEVLRIPGEMEALVKIGGALQIEGGVNTMGTSGNLREVETLLGAEGWVRKSGEGGAILFEGPEGRGTVTMRVEESKEPEVDEFEDPFSLKEDIVGFNKDLTA